MSKDIKASDHALWDDVRRTITPLAVRSSRTHGVKGKASVTAVRSTAAVAETGSGQKPQRPPGRAIPPLQALDRRTAQKLGRGQIEPDARIDLHGETLELARVKLQHFIARQRQGGARFILVITGKGASPFARHTLHGLSHFHAPEREGRLRREVPRWLAEDQFRQHVVGFQPSHPRHGGGGAFYVRLRKLPDGTP